MCVCTVHVSLCSVMPTFRMMSVTVVVLLFISQTPFMFRVWELDHI